MKVGRRLPIGLQIGLSAAALAGAVLLVFIAVSSVIVFDNMIEEADFVLKEQAKVLSSQFAKEEGRVDWQQRVIEVPLNAELAEIQVHYFTGPGVNWKTVDPFWDTDWLKTISWFEHQETVWSGWDVWRTYSIAWENGYAIALSMDLGELRQEVLKMGWTYFSALPITLMIVGVGGWWVARYSVAPLKKLASGMESVASGNFDRRLQLSTSSDALDKLAGIFNEMAGRLKISFDQATRFTSDASHELMTPVTVLRGQLEQALQESEGAEQDRLSELLAEVERLREILDALLLLSRSDAGQLSLERSLVDLSALTAEVAEDFQSAIEDSGLRLAQQIAPSVSLQGDKRLLRQALGNLLSNAIKYNRAKEGRIEVSLDTSPAHVRLCMENSGEPISPAMKEKVFARFSRGAVDGGSHERPGIQGTGIGLSIVKAITEAHGGRAWCEPGEEGNRFILEFPALRAH